MITQKKLLQTAITFVTSKDRMKILSTFWDLKFKSNQWNVNNSIIIWILNPGACEMNQANPHLFAWGQAYIGHHQLRLVETQSLVEEDRWILYSCGIVCPMGVYYLCLHCVQEIKFTKDAFQLIYFIYHQKLIIKAHDLTLSNEIMLLMKLLGEELPRRESTFSTNCRSVLRSFNLVDPLVDLHLW